MKVDFILDCQNCPSNEVTVLTALVGPATALRIAENIARQGARAADNGFWPGSFELPLIGRLVMGAGRKELGNADERNIAALLWAIVESDGLEAALWAAAREIVRARRKAADRPGVPGVGGFGDGRDGDGRVSASGPGGLSGVLGQDGSGGLGAAEEEEGAVGGRGVAGGRG